MKKIIYLLPLILMACGKDGEPGDTYVRFTWTGNQPYIFSTNNPAIPIVFYYGVDYITQPGTYSLYYETFYGVNYWWSVNYTLTYKDGEKGGIFKDGDDGEDSYFSINCDPYGPYIYQVKSQQIENDELFEMDEANNISISKEINGQILRVDYEIISEQEYLDKIK